MQLSQTPFRAWNLRLWMHGISGARSMSAMSRMSGNRRAQKEEGSISSLFASLNGETPSEFPARYLDLKRNIWRDEMVQSWREVLAELEAAAEQISSHGSEMIPQISYANLRAGLSQQQMTAIKRTGTVIVTGAVPKEEALLWKQSIKDYAAANQTRLRGFPPDNIQVFELYNSLSQTKARTHPAIITTQKALLSLWHADPSAEISLNTPISYFDRLRIRQPGDSKFALGPHVDGGSIERWEDPQYRTCYEKIFRGGSNWRNHDPFDVTPRIHAKQDLYNASNQCSIFRPWQGWTSMSSTGPNEGTLRVVPFLSLTCTYMMLRPFFRPRSANSASLRFDDWEIDTTTSAFPGTGLGGAQEFNKKTHPHLRLDKMMVSVPKVEPGDQVYWHCDVIHAVEAQHRGVSDSSVLYIPAVPLTLHNANYLRDQRSNFVSGLPAPDFPGGEGESKFVGRATIHDLETFEGRRMYGFEKIDGIPNVDFAKTVNQMLFD